MAQSAKSNARTILVVLSLIASVAVFGTWASGETPIVVSDDVSNTASASAALPDTTRDTADTSDPGTDDTSTGDTSTGDTGTGDTGTGDTGSGGGGGGGRGGGGGPNR
jgi:hypothetical protein